MYIDSDVKFALWLFFVFALIKYCNDLLFSVNSPNPPFNDILLFSVNLCQASSTELAQQTDTYIICIWQIKIGKNGTLLNILSYVFTWVVIPQGMPKISSLCVPEFHSIAFIPFRYSHYSIISSKCYRRKDLEKNL